MKILNCYIPIIIVILFSYLSPKEAGMERDDPGGEYLLGRIGFLHNFEQEITGPAGEVPLGIEAYGNVYYKFCSADKETIVTGGMLSKGINSVMVPEELITGPNKGVFYILIKIGENVTGKQIVLLQDRFDVEVPDAGTEEGSVNDRFRHEVTVTGDDSDIPDYHSRLVRDSVTGDYPGLNQGIPILPIVYLLGSKIIRSLKKKRRRSAHLYSETELYIKEGKVNDRFVLMKLRLLISEL